MTVIRWLKRFEKEKNHFGEKNLKMGLKVIFGQKIVKNGNKTLDLRKNSKSSKFLVARKLTS